MAASSLLGKRFYAFMVVFCAIGAVLDLHLAIQEASLYWAGWGIVMVGCLYINLKRLKEFDSENEPR